MDEAGNLFIRPNNGNTKYRNMASSAVKEATHGRNSFHDRGKNAVRLDPIRLTV